MSYKESSVDTADPIPHLHVVPSSPAKRRLRRGIQLLPCLFTVANLMCGCYAIKVVVDGNPLNYNNAARAIWIAWLFDALDGAFARATGTGSAFGREFDSLADIVTFGIAPAFLTYVWGLRPFAGIISQQTDSPVETSLIVGLFYIVCCAWRLARFNLQVTRAGENRFFAGLPTPAGALLLSALVHYHPHPIRDARESWLLLSLLTALALLMVSSVRHYSFKDIQWTGRQTSLTVIAVTILLAVIVRFSRMALLFIAAGYVCHGLIVELVRLVRHREEQVRIV